MGDIIAADTITLLKEVVNGTNKNSQAYQPLKVGLRALGMPRSELAQRVGSSEANLEKALSEAYGEAKATILLLPASKQGYRSDLEETSGPEGPKLGRTAKRVRRVVRTITDDDQLYALCDWIDRGDGSWKQAESMLKEPKKLSTFLSELANTKDSKALYRHLFAEPQKTDREKAKALYERARKLMAEAYDLVNDDNVIREIVSELNAKDVPKLETSEAETPKLPSQDLEGKILSALETESTRSSTAAKLAKELSVTTAEVVRGLKELETKGLVTVNVTNAGKPTTESHRVTLMGEAKEAA